MREIKFRAWNEKYKKFIYLDYLSLYGGYGIDSEYLDDKIIFSQYTGLKDKNKKEIYEGDIDNNGGVVSYVGSRYIIDYKKIDSWKELIGDEDEIIGNIYENPELLNA